MEIGSNKHQNGFTLIELLTVIAIMLFLAGIMIGAGRWMIVRSSIKGAEAQLMAINAALDAYSDDYRSYPIPVAMVDLFPDDADDDMKIPLYGLPLSCLSSQYADNKFSYYAGKINELDINLDGKLDSQDKFNDEYFLLDPWGFPIYYFVEKKTISVASSSYDAYFGRVNKNNCDLASRGPNNIPDSQTGGIIESRVGDDIVNWR